MSAQATALPFAGFAARREAAPSGRLDAIQFLRAVAVLMVVLYHLTTLFPDPLAARWSIPTPLYFGYAGVDVFFVVSGFIIYHVTRNEPFDLKSFVVKRLLRILPLYWLVTTMIVVICLVRPDFVAIRGSSFFQYLFDSYFLIPTRERPLLGVGWTLQHEFFFYALMALLLVVGARKWAVTVLLAIFAIGAVLRVIVDPQMEFWDWKVFSLYSLQFALGIAAYRINAQWRLLKPWALIAVAVSLFLVTSALATPLMNAEREVVVVTSGMFGLIRTVGFGLAAFALMLGVLNIPALQQLPSNQTGKLVLAIGDASFVIYLTHNLILRILALGTRHLPSSWLIGTATTCVALGLVIAVGITLHHLVERPLLAFMETRVTPRLFETFTHRRAIAARNELDETL